MAIPLREPAVAGLFYPGDPETLRRDVRSYTSSSTKKIRATACVVPHAGYVYSGHVAGAVFGRVELPQRFIVLCPNHTGLGAPLAIMSRGAWRTPLGMVPIDTSLADTLKALFPMLQEDNGAHLKEHAIEVELPFLQTDLAEFSFVPIAVGTGRFELLQKLGEAVAAALLRDREYAPGKILIVASSDMNHYESDEVTRVKDKLALNPLLALDPGGLYEAVIKEEISMCGFGPAVAALTAAKQLGAQSAELVKYATSAEVSGDYDRVVGYAGVVIS